MQLVHGVRGLVALTTAGAQVHSFELEEKPNQRPVVEAAHIRFERRELATATAPMVEPRVERDARVEWVLVEHVVTVRSCLYLFLIPA